MITIHRNIASLIVLDVRQPDLSECNQAIHIARLMYEEQIKKPTMNIDIEILERCKNTIEQLEHAFS